MGTAVMRSSRVAIFTKDVGRAFLSTVIIRYLYPSRINCIDYFVIDYYTAYLFKAKPRAHLLLLLLTRARRSRSSHGLIFIDKTLLPQYDRCHTLKSRIDIHFVILYYCQVNRYLASMSQ